MRQVSSVCSPERVEERGLLVGGGMGAAELGELLVTATPDTRAAELVA